AFAGHWIRERTGVADQNPAVEMIGPDAAIHFDDATDRLADKLDPRAAGMPDFQSLDRRGESLRHRMAMPMAGFAQDAHPNICPACGHREPPAVSWNDIFVEPYGGLALLNRKSVDVGALRNRDVRAVGHFAVERPRNEGFSAIGTDD